MYKVAVLMSTYNGEKFVEKQIESILAQKDVDVTLYIRDDASIDSTPEILKKYSYISNVHIIYSKRNMGPACGFMNLLYYISGYDYYAFADQDDIWLEDKISTAVRSIGITNRCIMYCSNQIIYFNNDIVGNRYSNKPNISLIGCLFSNAVSGCTMVLNSALRDKLAEDASKPKGKILALRMHDTWIMASSLLIGDVIYDNNGKILYRVHETNTVGLSGDNISIFNRLCKWINVIANKKKLNYRSIYASELIRCFPYADNEKIEKLKIISEYRYNFKYKLKMLSNKNIQRESGENLILYIFKVLFNVI